MNSMAPVLFDRVAGRQSSRSLAFTFQRPPLSLGDDNGSFLCSSSKGENAFANSSELFVPRVVTALCV